MPRNKSLTKGQQDNLRNSIARAAGQHIRRLNKHIEGKLELTNSQVKAIQMLLGKVVPDLSSTQVEDITPDYVNQDPRELEDQLKQLMRDSLAGMTPEEITIYLNDTKLDS